MPAPLAKPPVHDKPVHPFYFWLLRVAKGLGRFIYRPQVFGTEHIPPSGTPLILAPNHISYGDAAILQTVSPRHLRFLVFEPIYYHRALNWVMRLMRTIPIMPGRSTGALQKAVEALQMNHVVCIFPEGEISRTGELHQLRRGVERLVAATGASVVPVRIDGLRMWGPAKKRGQATVRFFPPLPAGEATVENIAKFLLPPGQEAPIPAPPKAEKGREDGR